MSVNEIKKELSKNRAVKIYKKILKGELSSFPYGYWARNEYKYEDARACVRYLVEVELELEREDMKKLTKNKIRTYKLGGMLNAVFDGDLYKCVENAYTFQFYPWDLSRCSKGFWDKDSGAIAIRECIRLRGWGKKEIKKNYGVQFYKETGLIHMLRTVFNGDMYEALSYAYDNEYKLWELRRVPNGYWTKDTIKEAVHWMIKELGYSKEDIKNKLCKNDFERMGLGGMLYNECGNSPYKALEIAYPGEFKIRELRSVCKGYWNINTGIEAIKDMIEEDLRYTKEDIKNKLCKNDFIKCGYEYVLEEIFEGDIYKVVNLIYPNEFKKAHLRAVRFSDKESLIVKKMLWYD